MKAVSSTGRVPDSKPGDEGSSPSPLAHEGLPTEPPPTPEHMSQERAWEIIQNVYAALVRNGQILVIDDLRRAVYRLLDAERENARGHALRDVQRCLAQLMPR